ncbi:MAG: hypothetical protein Ct9H300mP23_10830 [Nitrospinota bacterium]|nr:MAG: hypothetical protein Ct9H300mP23_10830 [Nitrospinota bacterium]
MTKKLNTISTSNSSINSEKELSFRGQCTRQKTDGGFKNAVGRGTFFKGVAEAKKYSNYGMQIDSQLNRLVFSLKHICRGAKGMPLNGWGRTKVEELQKYGKEKMREIYIELGIPLLMWTCGLRMQKEELKAGNVIFLFQRLANPYRAQKIWSACMKTFHFEKWMRLP